MFAGNPFSIVDGCNYFFRCESSPQLLSCLDFFLYFSTVRMICMFQSSKGFRRRTRTCCLQKEEINVHTFLYV